jgi:hypothetical protein
MIPLRRLPAPMLVVVVGASLAALDVRASTTEV